MKNFTPFLLISLVLYSCEKHTELPISNTPSPPAPPPQIVAPVASVGIIIDGQAMNITSLSYQRQTSGVGGIWITAENDFQKVTAVASPFTEFGSSGYTCRTEVSYFTRSDIGSGWGVTYPRLVPRDDKMMFNECTPLRAKVLTGNFSGSFIDSTSSLKDEHRITVTGNFSLVF